MRAERGEAASSQLAGLLTDALTSTADDKWNGVGQLRVRRWASCSYANAPQAELPHRRIDFQLIARRSWACALLYFTGSSLFNRSMRHYAGKHGANIVQCRVGVGRRY